MQLAMVNIAMFSVITSCTKEDFHKPAFSLRRSSNSVESIANTKVSEALEKKKYTLYPHHFLSFKKLTENQISKMPVYIWRGVPRRVTLLPKEFWPFIKNTKIYSLGFRGMKMGAVDAQDLVKNLQNTPVRIINLSNNKLGKNGAVNFIKNLVGTQIHTVNFSANNIGNDGAVELAENLKDTPVCTVRLVGNQIEAETQEFLKKTYPKIQWLFQE